MSGRRPLIAALTLLAASIWGWNLYLLVEVPEPVPDLDRDLPELPETELSRDPRTYLPELVRDPFDSRKLSQSNGPTAPGPDAGGAKAPKPRVAPPRLTLLLIMKRSPLPEAVFQNQSGETLTLSPGGQIGDWTVEKITLDHVLLAHESGAVHEIAIQ